MAFVNVPGRFFYPEIEDTIFNQNNPGSSTTMDAAADYVGWVFTVPKTGTLRTAHVEMTQQTSIQDIRFSFQNVDANNEPDGTEDQYRVYTPVGGDLNQYASPGIMSSDGTDGGVKRSVTQGDRIALVIRFESTAGDIDFRRGLTRAATKDEVGPYAVFSTNSGTSWSLFQTWPTFMLEYETDGIVHVPQCWPMLTRNTVSMGNASTPDEIGFKFQVPFACKVVGVVLGGPSTTDAVVGLETAGGSALATAVDALWEPDTGGTAVKRTYYFEEAEVELSADTNYYVTWKPTTATSRTMYNWNLEDAAARAALPWGTTSSYNTRTDAGAWTEETTKTVIMSLIISAIDDGAGGSPPTCNYGAIPNGTRVKPAAK
jgi:hypothetical protein